MNRLLLFLCAAGLLALFGLLVPRCGEPRPPVSGRQARAAQAASRRAQARAQADSAKASHFSARAARAYAVGRAFQDSAIYYHTKSHAPLSTDTTSVLAYLARFFADRP